MPKEIERKFLVLNDDWKKEASTTYSKIIQGYIAHTDSLNVRVRVMTWVKEGKQTMNANGGLTKCWITIKSNAQLERDEFEYEIPYQDAKELLAYATSKVEKIRHYVPCSIRSGRSGYSVGTWEVDVFPNGVVVAEIEMEHKNQTIPTPDWLGEEVTQDPKYYNINISRIETKE